MVNWHCKGICDYGSPDYMQIWPISMSGICLAAIINLAMVVLTFLQPTSPAKPITHVKKGELPRQTLNNARGYFFPYGDLKHLPALDDPDSQPISASNMAHIINAAISAAGFLGKCWTDVRAAAYMAAYGSRLPYLRDAGRAMATVTFVKSMLSWSPATVNKDVCSQLSEAQQAALKKAVEMGQQFAANPTSPVIREHLTSLVEQEGSLAGMLRRVAVPLLHQYALPAFEAGPDLIWLCMTPTEAQAYRSKLLQTISSATEALYGPQPQPPPRLPLLQNTIDLLCADVDSVKLSLASPQARTSACVGSATAAVLSALHSAAAVAAATARGDDLAAGRAAAAAAASAQAALQHAQQLQLDASDVPAALFGGQASAGTEAEASADLAGSFDSRSAAAATAIGPAPTLLNAGGGNHNTTPPTTAAAAITSAAPSPSPSLQLAVAGAQLSTQLAQGPTSPLLRRGVGLLVLFPNNWGGKAQLLQAGKAVIAGKTFTHSSVLQLISQQDLLLRAGSEQSVSVRVAADYLAPSTPLTGNWSKSCFTISITPGVNLLLHSAASHTWGRKFTAKCSAAAGYASLFPGLSQANITSALGRLEYEPHRPVRSCAELTNATNRALLQAPAACSGSAGASWEQQQQARPVPSAVAPVQTGSEPPTGGGELAAAQTAVYELALSISGAEADAAYGSACFATAVLLRRSSAPATSNMAAAVRSGLLAMYQAVVAGNAPPVAALKQLLAQLREAAGCSSSIAAELPAEVAGGQQVASSSNKRQNEVAAVASSSKKPKQPAAQQRDPPAGADKRPGLWLTGGLYAQLGDTLIQQVKKAARDPCTFNVYNTEGEVASAWVWRLEAFTDDSVTGRFYFNKQRSLHEPLNFQHNRVQKLPQPAGVAGVVYTMAPDVEGDLSEVLQQLHPAVVAEIEELIFDPVDSNSETE